MTGKSRKPPAVGTKALQGSAEARRAAAILLQVLGGLKTTQAASDELGVALPRYYVLETRALQAMIAALEPRPRGRQKTEAAQLVALRQDNQRLQRELLRAQALQRATQRTVESLEPPARRRRRQAQVASTPRKVARVRRKSRGERILAELGAAPGTMAATQGGGCDGDRATEQGRGTHRRTAGHDAGPATPAGDPGDDGR